MNINIDKVQTRKSLVIGFGKLIAGLGLVAFNFANKAAADGPWDPYAQLTSTQGSNGWYYQERPQGSTTPVTNMIFSAAQWRTSNFPATGSGWLGYYSGVAGHPGQTCDIVRKWVAPSSGTVSITGRVYKTDTGGGGGIKATVEKQGTMIWSKIVAYNDTIGYSTDPSLGSVSVSAGDSICFIVDDNGTFGNDSYAWDPVIIKITPSSDAYADLTSAQGQVWYYQQRPQGTTSPVSNMNYSDGEWRTTDYGSGSAKAGWLGYYAGMAGHPGGSLDIIRKWVAPTSGTVSITGRVYKVQTGTGGAGIIATVEKQGTVLWSQTVTANDSTGYSTDSSLGCVSVNSGDSICFVVDDNGQYNSDGYGWEPIVDYSNITAMARGDIYDMNDGRNNTNPEGDTWVSNWSSNGDALVSINDGEGWDYSSATGQRGFGKLTGDPNYNTTLKNFWGISENAGVLGSTRNNFNSGNTLGYHMGIFEKDGVIYDCINNYHGSYPDNYSAFIKSTDGGSNWYNHAGGYNTPTAMNSAATSMFTPETNLGIIRFGQGADAVPVGDGLDAYFYIAHGFKLGRVAISDFSGLDNTKYSWFSGLVAGVPQWDSSEANAASVPGLTNFDNRIMTMNGAMIYNFGLQKYLMAGYSDYWPPGETQNMQSWGYGFPRYHIMAADHPWGPWTEIGNMTGLDSTKFIGGFSLYGSTVAEYLMSNKFTSADGKLMWMATSGTGIDNWPAWSTHGEWHYGFQYMPIYFSTGAVTRYEAESGTLSGNATNNSTYPNASGGHYVDNFSTTGDKVLFNLTSNINGTGWHIVTIRYTNPTVQSSNNPNTMSVYVNGSKARTITLAENNDDNDTTGYQLHYWTNDSQTYYLNAGTSNTFEIRCDSGSGDVGTGFKVDYIDVSTELTYNQGADLAPSATPTSNTGTAGNANKGYVDYSTEWAPTTSTDWIKLTWGAAQTINKVVLYDLVDTNKQVLTGKLTFSDGSTFVPVGKLQNDGHAGGVVAFSPRSVTWVKFEVLTGTGNAGLGEIQVFNDTNLRAGSW